MTIKLPHKILNGLFYRDQNLVLWHDDNKEHTGKDISIHDYMFLTEGENPNPAIVQGANWKRIGKVSYLRQKVVLYLE